MEKNSKIVGITSTGDSGSDGNSHVFFIGSDQALCGYDVGFENTQVLPDYVDVRDRDTSMCEECISYYNEWLGDGGEREPTVKCKCDAMSSEGPQRCQKVVSAYKARELSHPTRTRNLPVCPTCYRWIESLESNSVETEYKEARPWLTSSVSQSTDQIG